MLRLHDMRPTQALGDRFVPALGSMPLAGCRLGKMPPSQPSEAEIGGSSPGARFMARAKVRTRMGAHTNCAVTRGSCHRKRVDP